MKNRTIKSILYATPMDMGGMPIRQPFPSAKAEQIDPFLLLHHADIKVPTHVETRHAGVGPHPHRGFSPVSFIFKGGVHHRDSRGNNNIVYAGGTQWMNAGMGVIHSERPPADIHEIGGRQELIQLWVNTPAKHKMDAPQYQPLTAEETPVVRSGDGSTSINVIAGELDGVKGPIKTLSDVNTFTATIRKGGKYFFNIPSSHNAFIYVMDGKLTVTGDGEVDAKYVAVFNNDGDGFELEATEDTRLFIGTGEPLNEPMVSHGPFVMNNQTELMEAFRDYQLGKMGVLIED
ncbi:pirin family protein [Sediminibacterium roseum]|uniref:Pirin family protein n=1 Tax=Sediminibacterium roseum TaxID=1978412 RepID=A0ABX0A210_9BACT|nr:pirin family protein [Sediminibacterium roseum]NCI51987.1 pirin family protein [Sediminibacterium roseum]